MKNKIINIISNSNFESKKTTNYLVDALRKKEFKPTFKFNPNAELVICVGGDGSFLKAFHKNQFNHIPYIGINTGHLGFFQEISPNKIDEFINDYIEEKYVVDNLKLVSAYVYTNTKKITLTAINEIVLRAQNYQIIHINIFLDNNYVEKFSGDGILISTPSGSTAYNFSCGGSIVYPTLDALQMTPISPVSSSIYRSLKNSLIINKNQLISLVPEKRYSNSNIVLVDGIEYSFDNLKRINLKISKKELKRITFSKNYYWNNLKNKFL